MQHKHKDPFARSLKQISVLNFVRSPEYQGLPEALTITKQLLTSNYSGVLSTTMDVIVQNPAMAVGLVGYLSSCVSLEQQNNILSTVPRSITKVPEKVGALQKYLSAQVISLSEKYKSNKLFVAGTEMAKAPYVCSSQTPKGLQVEPKKKNPIESHNLNKLTKKFNILNKYLESKHKLKVIAKSSFADKSTPNEVDRVRTSALIAQQLTNEIEAALVTIKKDKVVNYCDFNLGACRGNFGIERSMMPQIMDQPFSKLSKLRQKLLKKSISNSDDTKLAARIKEDVITKDIPMNVVWLKLLEDKFGAIETRDVQPKYAIASQREILATKSYTMAAAFLKGTFDGLTAGGVLAAAEENGTNVVVDGHHRWAAATSAGVDSMRMDVIPAKFQDIYAHAHDTPGVFRLDLNDQEVGSDKPLFIGW